MLNKFIPILLIPLIVYSAQQIKSVYTFQAPEVIKGRVYMEGCNTYGMPFSPALPRKAAKLYLGHGIEPESFTVTYSDPVYLSKKYDITAFKPPVSPSLKPLADHYTRRSTVYDNDEFFPASVETKDFTLQRMFGHNIFITWFNPVQYNPVSEEIRYYRNIEISIKLKKVRSEFSYRFTPFIKSQIKRLVDNKEAVDNLPYDTRAATCDYLIITTEALKGAFGTFIDFNKKRGLRTKVQSVDYIKSNYQGEDDAEKIRACIKDEYDNTGIHFVLLGEDDDRNETNDVQHRGFYVEMYDNGKVYTTHADIAADMYFGTLDGTWKAAGSSNWGELGTEDMGYEVYVARFAVDDAGELNKIVNKTIKYSEEPVKDQVKNALMAGEFLWGPPDLPKDIWGGDNLDLLIGTQDIYTQKNVGFPTSGWNITKLYDEEQTWSSSKFSSTVRDEDHIIINHNGHANTNYCFKMYSTSVTDQEFDNNGTNANFFIMYSAIGCYPGSFDNMSGDGSSYMSSDCFAEKITAEINNGAVACIMNSRTGWGGDYDENSASGRPHRWFYDAIFDKGIHHIGQMRAYVAETDADLITDPNWNDSLNHWGGLRWSVFESNILGDPALSLWTDTPSELQADHPTQCSGSDTKFTWDTKKPYTTVALLSADRGDIICSQITGEDGKCEITDDAFNNYVSANVGKKMTINVKAHNYLPYSGEIEIVATNIENTPKPLINKLNFINNAGSISYYLSVAGNVTISIYDSKGALVKTVVNKYQDAGNHTVSFINYNLCNGIYYLRMAYNSNNLVKKFVAMELQYE